TNTAAALAFSDSRNGIAIVGNQLCVKPAPGVPEGSAAVLTTADGGLTWKRQTTLARYTTSLSIAKGLAVTTGVAGCVLSPRSIESLSVGATGCRRPVSYWVWRTH